MNPILVEIWRGPMVESFHRGAIVVVGEQGQTLWSMGNPEQWAYPRSAMKYFQHLPFLQSGAFDRQGWGAQELAILCASHNGEAMHTELVSRMLNELNLSPDDLGCGAQAPTLRKDQEALILKGQKPSCLHNNCSGKHTGFLAASLANQYSTSDYLHAEHPLQIGIRKTVSLFYEMPEEALKLGIDGCSAPIFGMPLRNQALAYLNLILPERITADKDLQQACQRVVQAVSQYPELIAGNKRYCSDLVRITKGRIIGKTGADGIYSLAIPSEKIAMVIKIDDGKMGPQYQVAHQLLTELNLLTVQEQQDLEAYSRQPIANFAGNTVGYTQSVTLNCSF
jgi:L-asparaginase II